MEIARAAADSCRQIGQGRLLLAFLDQTTGTSDDGDVLRFNRRPIWIAALAWPKAGRHGVLKGVMKLDVFWIGGSGCAGWPAVNARCHDRVPQMAVSRTIAGNNACPARVIGYIRVIRF